VDRGLPKEAGYAQGINPGLLLFEKCKECGIKETSIYCFTQDNTRRPSIQKQAFSEASVAFAFEIARRGAALLVVGDETSTQFPKALNEFRHRQGVGMKVNLLVIVRWGGRRRLSGFLPVQSIYADFYVRDEYWPDFDLQHFENALAWFKNQDPTLGG
jgi:undecaprenyl diphosphate synthase